MCWPRKVMEMRKRLREELLNTLTNDEIPYNESIEYLEPIKDDKSRIRIILTRKRSPYDLTIEESKQTIENCNFGLFTCPKCSKEYFDNKNTKKDGDEYSDWTTCPICKTKTNVAM